MHHRGISTDGYWAGANLMAAIDKMLQDYCRRMESFYGRSPLTLEEP
jgi:hypothetical protein